jgi:hypothetical protein
VRDYAVDEQNAVMAPIKRSDLLAKQTLRLLRDDTLRVRLANAGNAFIQEFTWDRAGEAMDQLLRRSPVADTSSQGSGPLIPNSAGTRPALTGPEVKIAP